MLDDISDKSRHYASTLVRPDYARKRTNSGLERYSSKSSIVSKISVSTDQKSNNRYNHHPESGQLLQCRLRLQDNSITLNTRARAGRRAYVRSFAYSLYISTEQTERYRQTAGMSCATCARYAAQYNACYMNTWPL